MSPDAVSGAPKCSKIRFRPRLRRTLLEELTDLLAALTGPTCKRKKRSGKRKGQKKGKENSIDESTRGQSVTGGKMKRMGLDDFLARKPKM